MTTQFIAITQAAAADGQITADDLPPSFPRMAVDSVFFRRPI